MQYEYIYKLCKKYSFYVGNYKILKNVKNVRVCVADTFNKTIVDSEGRAPAQKCNKRPS